MSEYVETQEWGQGQETQLAEMYHILAEFCDAQVRGGELDKQIEKLAAAVAQREHDLAELEKYASSAGRDATQRKNARRAHQRLCVQQEAEQEELALCRPQRGPPVRAVACAHGRGRGGGAARDREAQVRAVAEPAHFSAREPGKPVPAHAAAAGV
ncbi:hypothetical protein KL922_004761 [Ogataea haglerorum]|nr:hypothetical protein KL922_004761 [Ogataea haglerorum]